ncbi:hypothetical protein K1W69_11260 [Hoeflea sp. WL0058]|uniref:Glycosyl transferase n=1 Tax=Flavimaribacter sediminis TaxID=2865987 RepID=A0AAE2ZKC1_9HYPH|nr:glycosyltransferase family protein [Flavimaribacter sediminis]MBW8637766.1 hypothetical protein [Flavimaribacter sediminis]
MKILYGVHTIGFGHLSAALALVPQLKQRGANVTCYLCGRDPSQLPDLPQLRPYTTHRGADVPFTDGKLNQMGYYASLAANVAQVARQVGRLELTDYDLVLTDSEYVTAFAARLKNTFSISVTHLTVYEKPIPKKKLGLGDRLPFISPAGLKIHPHWGCYGQNDIVPPIYRKSDFDVSEPDGSVVVYLDTFSPERIVDILRLVDFGRFVIYSRHATGSQRHGNVETRPFDSEGFKSALASASGVICSAGFLLATEALGAGKRLLLVPVEDHHEQLSNAMVLHDLGLASVTHQLTSRSVEQWIAETFAEAGPLVEWPDTAGAIAEWILQGRQEWNHDRLAELSQTLWSQVKMREAGRVIRA